MCVHLPREAVGGEERVRPQRGVGAGRALAANLALLAAEALLPLQHQEAGDEVGGGGREAGRQLVPPGDDALKREVLGAAGVVGRLGV